MGEWKEYKLGEILTIKYGKDHKGLADGNIPIYGSGGIMRYGNRSLYDGPSILIPRKGTLNNIMYSDNPFWTVDTMFWTIINEELANPLFVYYSICKKDFASLNVGSAVPSLTVPVIGDIDILLPSKNTQKNIVAILKTLDDKIENNRRINENLEQQAQALFKSWFVDFEPFKDGEFVDSELGMIPKGWKVKCIEDFCDVFTGKKNVDKSSSNGLYPFFSCSPTHTFSNEFIYDGETILVAGNGSYTGRTSYYIGKFDLYQRTYACVLKTEQSKELSSFLYYMMKILFEPKKMGGTRGSSIPYIVMKDLTLQKFSYNENVVKRFSNVAYTILLEILKRNEESRRLAELRDTLLPRLMSGELKINEIV